MEEKVKTREAWLTDAKEKAREVWRMRNREMARKRTDVLEREEQDALAARADPRVAS